MAESEGNSRRSEYNSIDVNVSPYKNILQK